MAAGKEIRTKIKSVENTRKITKAMEMVAASKMRKAQERMNAARPYAEKIARVATHLAYANTEYKHPFVIARDTVKRVGLIVVTSDKGLCGGLNTNALRVVVSQMKQWEAAGVEIDVTAIGNKGLGFMQRLGANVASQVTGLGDTPHMEKLIGPVKVMLDAYLAGRIDALYIVYNRFVNTMKQEPTLTQLLPLPAGRCGRSQPENALGLYLRARCQAGGRRDADALHRVAGVSGRGREHRVRAVGAHGGDEGRVRQRQGRHRRTEADLQQDPPGRDYQGTVGDRRRRGRGLNVRANTEI